MNRGNNYDNRDEELGSRQRRFITPAGAARGDGKKDFKKDSDGKKSKDLDRKEYRSRRRNSRSPSSDRDRSRGVRRRYDRRDDHRKRSRSRSWDREKRKYRSRRSPSRSSSRDGKRRDQEEEEKFEDEDEEARMLRVMGIAGFGSSKGKSHNKSSAEAVCRDKTQKRTYRQYMNRRGGFNRSLDPIQ